MKDHVVIVGGGVTGALTAATLADRGFAVTVLEKGELGNGSSRRSAASIRAQFTVEETVVGMMYAEWYYGRFHEIMETPGGAKPVFRQNGYLFLYEHPESARPRWDRPAGVSARMAWNAAVEGTRMQRRVGVPVEVLTPDEILERWPHLTGVTLIGATWCPQDGFLDARAIYQRAFDRARELGAVILTGTEVIGARLSRGRISGLDTTAGRFEADWFVNGTNAWAGRFSRLVGGMHLSVAPTKRYLYRVAADGPGADGIGWNKLPMTIFGGGSGRGAFARPVFDRGEDGSRLQAGWAHDSLPEPDFADADQDRVEPAFDHREGEDTYGYAVLDQLREFAPKLAAESKITATECGYYGVTPDHTPIIGVDTNQANLVHAVGFSGHGLMHAPFTAALVSAAITGASGADRFTFPEPLHGRVIDTGCFAPGRSFAAPEGLVL